MSSKLDDQHTSIDLLMTLAVHGAHGVYTGLVHTGVQGLCTRVHGARAPVCTGVVCTGVHAHAHGTVHPG